MRYKLKRIAEREVDIVVLPDVHIGTYGCYALKTTTIPEKYRNGQSQRATFYIYGNSLDDIGLRTRR